MTTNQKTRMRELALELGKLSDEEWGELCRVTEKDMESNKQKASVTLEKEIFNGLKSLGVPSNVKGKKYLAEGIKLMYEDECAYASITKQLYPAIARKFSTTPSRVERAIRHAIEISFSNTDVDVLEEIFGCGYSRYSGKATNSQFICGIVEYLRFRIEK